MGKLERPHGSPEGLKEISLFKEIIPKGPQFRLVKYYLFGGLEHVLFSHILGIIIPID